MAKKSIIARNKRRADLINANWEVRTKLREASKKGDHEAQVKLNKMSRDSSPSRYKNRDMIDGRGHAYMRRFGLSRINFRKKAHKGQLPGVKKASW